MDQLLQTSSLTVPSRTQKN